MGKIFYLMGKSASGKDSIYKRLRSVYPELKSIVLYTTRPMRAGEQEGVEYYFIDDARLKKLEQSGRVIEVRTYQTVFGPWSYATVDDGQVDLAQENYLVIATLDYYEKLREYYGKEALVPQYVMVDDGVRLERALARERQQKVPKYAELCRRFLADEADFAPERLKGLDVTEAFENRELEVCVRAIADRIQMEGRQEGADCYCTRQAFSERKMPYGTVVAADFADLECGALAERKKCVILFIDMP